MLPCRTLRPTPRALPTEGPAGGPSHWNPPACFTPDLGLPLHGAHLFLPLVAPSTGSISTPWERVGNAAAQVPAHTNHRGECFGGGGVPVLLSKSPSRAHEVLYYLPPACWCSHLPLAAPSTHPRCILSHRNLLSPFLDCHLLNFCSSHGSPGLFCPAQSCLASP